MKIIILVLSYNDDGLYTEMCEAQKKTWDSVEVENIKTYYYFGNGDEDKIIGNTIITTIKEGIPNCGYKTIKCFELIKDLDFDFVFRTNSSSYVDKEMLMELVKTKNKTKHYSGVIGNSDGVTFASGSGYLISKDVMLKLIENKYLTNNSLIDDVSFAEVLSKLEIYPESNQRYDVVGDCAPSNYFHYRLYSSNRYNDINNMYKIFELKKIK